MYHRPPTIKDARGQRVAYADDGGGMSDLKAEMSDEEYIAFKSVFEKEVWQSDWNLLTPMTPSRAVSIMLGPFIMIATASLLTSRGVHWILSAVVCGIPYGIWERWRLLRRLNSMHQHHPYAQTLLGITRCPACLYSLKGIDADADNCTVCPECGGAWRLP